MFSAGWNDLPLEEKKLELVDIFISKNTGAEVYDLYCLALDLKISSVFPDELYFCDDQKKES